MAIPYDWVFYLFATQTLPICLLLDRERNQRMLWYIVLFQVVSFAVLWLVFGGYTTDAPRYLTRFERNPFLFQNEQLFWILGHFLSELLKDPWPLKVLSFLCSLLISFGYLVHTKSNGIRCQSLVLWLAALVPAFFFLEGNVVRQGISFGILLLFAKSLLENKWFLACGFAILGFLFHQFSLVLFVALLTAYLAPALVVYAVLAGLLIGISGEYVAGLFHIDLRQYVPYADRLVDHHIKLVCYSAVAVVLLATRSLLRGLDPRDKYWIDATLYYFAAMLVFLRFGEPFERLGLLFQLLLPLSFVFLIRALLTSKFTVPQICLMVILVNVLSIPLWLHPSMTATLGFT